MRGLKRRELEDLLEVLAYLGVFALFAWVAVGGVGIGLGLLDLAYGPSVRFLVAILVLAAPEVVKTEVRRARLRAIPVDERLGFVADSTDAR